MEERPAVCVCESKSSAFFLLRWSAKVSLQLCMCFDWVIWVAANCITCIHLPFKFQPHIYMYLLSCHYLIVVIVHIYIDTHGYLLTC